jgi:hypothetical protein
MMVLAADFFPPEPEIDETRHGVLTVGVTALQMLLGLPRDHRISGLRLTFAGDLQIDIVGADMPDDSPFLPKPVVLLCHTARDKPLELSWAHKPDKRWTLP